MNSLKKVSIFHCVNAFNEKAISPIVTKGIEFNIIPLPCSGMIKEIYLLKAFEAGADAVAVFVCPELQCRYLQGSRRAQKRVKRVKALLEEIGIDKNRLSIYHTTSNDIKVIEKYLMEICDQLLQYEVYKKAA